jgi:hypothetical protein
VLTLLRRYPLQLLVPAAGLGLVADAVQLVESPLAGIGVSLALAVAFEGYVAYAERLVTATRSDSARIRVLNITRAALPRVPALLVASVGAIALPLTATGLLIVPGLWLLTRWSLFAPAIARDDLGPVAGLRRSDELVRGHFAFVFVGATLPLLVEHAVVHATALTAESVVTSTVLAMLFAGAAVAAISPFAALSVSLTFDRLAAGSATASAAQASS